MHLDASCTCHFYFICILRFHSISFSIVMGCIGCVTINDYMTNLKIQSHIYIWLLLNKMNLSKKGFGNNKRSEKVSCLLISSMTLKGKCCYNVILWEFCYTHDITEILLKVVFNTITLNNKYYTTYLIYTFL
jgi:hypothetical protein